MNESLSKEILFVPELINLPVHEETRTDQKTIDTVLHHLWKNRPDLVAELAKQERRPVPDSRDAMHRKACARIGEYLRGGEVKEIEVPESRLGLLDVLFEASRRLRKAQGLKEVPIFGKPLAPSREGPFPDIFYKEVSVNKDGMTQEIADKLCLLAYERDPQLMFDYCEQTRRLMGVHEITGGVGTLVKRIKEEIQAPPSISYGELVSRLSHMCKMPTYEKMKGALES